MDRHKKLREEIKKGNTPVEKKESSIFRKEKKKEVEEEYTAYQDYDDAFEYDEPLTKKERKKAKKQAKKQKKIRKKKKRHPLRWIVGLLVLVLLAAIGNFLFGLTLGGDNPHANQSNFNGVASANGANNILILGTDARVGQDSGSTRSDSIMILQLDGPGRKPRLLSIMRDTLVTIPNVGQNQKINSAFTIGEQNNHQGAELMRETIKENFGIDLRYYAMVDFASFAKIIDTLFPSGVKIDAQFATVNGQVVSSVEVPDDLSQVGDGPIPTQTIHVGEQRMSGQTLLNYARFRHDDENDFGRVKRQQQVMQAITSQLRNPMTVFNGSRALGQVVGFTSTDVPNTYILSQVLNVLLGANEFERLTVPIEGQFTNALDWYGGEGLLITDWNATINSINSFLGQ
ncbi:MAG: LCP family protein [Streptococcaceae bacterium]|jgi:LCP family protein required for cell wall assembly|nr:LCP family protein [Streptococcaceae bacterium]